jgi:phytoene/squalene synthetase
LSKWQLISFLEIRIIGLIMRARVKHLPRGKCFTLRLQPEARICVDKCDKPNDLGSCLEPDHSRFRKMTMQADKEHLVNRIHSSESSQCLAARITQAASKQTYYTVRYLVDRPLIPDAYRAYAYFRWVDDYLDQEDIDKPQRLAFVGRQQALMERCYRGEPLPPLTDEERMLVDLIDKDFQKSSGLQSYIRNMMAVMAFDAERRGRLISQAELADYSRWLAAAVTEALHYFIGHEQFSPRGEARYLAAAAAHIVHMLRDTAEDVQAGYYNIPGEYLKAHGISAWDVDSAPYRAWVRGRVQLARSYFTAGRGYLAQVENLRCRLAGYAYIARFEGVLGAIEAENYRLRPDYSEYKRKSAGLQMGWSVLALALTNRRQPARQELVIPASHMTAAQFRPTDSKL